MHRAEALLVAVEGLEPLHEPALEQLREACAHLLAPAALGRAARLGRRDVRLAEPFSEPVIGVARQLPLASPGERRRPRPARRVDRTAHVAGVARERLDDGEPAVDREDADLEAGNALALEESEGRAAGEAPGCGPEVIEGERDDNGSRGPARVGGVANELERLDLLPHAVFEKLDLLRPKVAHERALLVADDEVHVDALGCRRDDEARDGGRSVAPPRAESGVARHDVATRTDPTRSRTTTSRSLGCFRAS